GGKHGHRAVSSRSGICLLHEHCCGVQQHAYIVAHCIGHNEVAKAATGQVAYCQRHRTGACGQSDGRLEGAVAVAQHHHDVVVARVGDGDIRLAIVVVIHHHDGTWSVPGSQRVADREQAGAVVDQHRDVIAVLVADGDIQLAVTVEVAKRDA